MSIRTMIRQAKVKYREKQFKKLQEKRQIHLEDVAFENKLKKAREVELQSVKAREQRMEKEAQIRNTKGRIMGAKIQRIKGAFKKAGETSKKMSLGSDDRDTPFSPSKKKKEYTFV